MTNKEAKYLLRNTGWLAPSLEPIDEAIDMACDALDMVEYINSQLGKPKTEPTISKMEQVPNCIDCTHYGDYEVCKGCDDDYNKFKSYYEPKDEPQTERGGE